MTNVQMIQRQSDSCIIKPFLVRPGYIDQASPHLHRICVLQLFYISFYTYIQPQRPTPGNFLLQYIFNHSIIISGHTTSPGQAQPILSMNLQNSPLKSLTCQRRNGYTTRWQRGNSHHPNDHKSLRCMSQPHR